MLRKTLVALILLFSTAPAVADGWYGPARIRDITWIDGFGAVRFTRFPAGCAGNGWFSTYDNSGVTPYLLAAYAKGSDVWYAPNDCTQPYTTLWAISTSRPTNAVRPKSAAANILDSIEPTERAKEE